MKKLKEILGTGTEEQQEQALKQALKVKFDQDLRLELERDLNRDQHRRRHITWGRSRTFKWSVAWISIAASLLLLFALLVWYIPVSNSPDLLVTQYLSEPMLHPGSSKGISTGNDLRSSAITLYNEGAYSSAIEFYQQMDDKTIEDSFYLSISLLKVEQIQDACLILSTLNQHPSTYQEEVRWYLALCLYQSADLAQARKLLLSFEEGDWKYEEASKLLQSLQ